MDEYIFEPTDDYPGVEFGSDDYSGTIERRERVVRCRDCRWSFEERGKLWCRGIVGPPVEPDIFCAWDEPRDDAMDYFNELVERIAGHDGD